MSEAVERYLGHLGARDWDGLATTLTLGAFERVGPFCDVITDTSAYLEYLAEVLSPMERYEIRVRRLTGAGTVAFVEIDESFVLDGTPMSFPEVLVFDLDGEGRIARVQVYLMRPGEPARSTG